MHQIIELSSIDESLSVMRLTRPEQIGVMQRSLEKLGQLQGVVVRKIGSEYQLLDGFKRVYGARALNWDQLSANVVEVDDITAKTMILSYNQLGNSLIDYEEAQIVYSLKKEHLLDQKSISVLLVRSRSWVSRRLSYIEKLSQEVQSHLQLGQISATHARELVKLPRGKQLAFLKLIIENGLTSRQTSKLVSMYLQCRTSEQEKFILTDPLKALEQQTLEAQIHDNRLSLRGNRLKKTMSLLIQQQHIFIGQSTRPPLDELTQMDLDVLWDDFRDIVKKAQMIQSILGAYDQG